MCLLIYVTLPHAWLITLVQLTCTACHTTAILLYKNVMFILQGLCCMRWAIRRPLLGLYGWHGEMFALYLGYMLMVCVPMFVVEHARGYMMWSNCYMMGSDCYVMCSSFCLMRTYLSVMLVNVKCGYMLLWPL